MKDLDKQNNQSAAKNNHKSQSQSTEIIETNLKDELRGIKNSIDLLWKAIKQDEFDESGLAKESEDSAMAICDILERLEKMEETIIYVQEESEKESRKREWLGCVVIFCGGILFCLMLYAVKAYWLGGVVFWVTLIGASLYAKR